MIELRAYDKAQGRGFTPGSELRDWLEAEREVDRELAAAPHEPLLADRAPQAATFTTAIEQRRGQRASISLPVRLDTHDGRAYHGICTNISRDGMFVRTPAQLRIGSFLDLRFESIRVSAEVPVFVVHQSASGMGVMFRGPDLAARLLARLGEPGAVCGGRNGRLDPRRSFG